MTVLDKKTQSIIHAAIVAANTITKTAVENVTTPDELGDQIFFCRVIAIQLLCTELLNFKKQQIGSEQDFVQGVIKDMLGHMGDLKDTPMELAKDLRQ